MSHTSNPLNSVSLLFQLLECDRGQLTQSYLACLDTDALDCLQTNAPDLNHRAVCYARDLLDVALELLEFPLSQEHQRRLLERVDEELASAQRWGELAANARFCLVHPDLAHGLSEGGDRRRRRSGGLRKVSDAGGG